MLSRPKFIAKPGLQVYPIQDIQGLSPKE